MKDFGRWFEETAEYLGLGEAHPAPCETCGSAEEVCGCEAADCPAPSGMDICEVASDYAHIHTGVKPEKVELKLSHVEAMAFAACETCGGSGDDGSWDAYDCPDCAGLGFVEGGRNVTNHRG